MPDSADPLQVLRKFGRSDFYVPAKGTSKFLQRYKKVLIGSGASLSF